MKLTQEQELIVNSKGDLKINAVAGSGKTTTIVEYAKKRPYSRILYLAFNKSVRIEAEKKFSDKGLTNVTVETAHSLAYRHIVRQNGYSVKHSYKTDEVVEILNLKSTQRHAEFVLANHVLKFVSYFCNSNKEKVEELDYRGVVFDSKAKTFVNTFYKDIEQNTRIFLSKMNKGEIGVTHDFYLKKFQLQNPNLYYDFILFDEGQDASPTILDVFLKQGATKIIVGDTHQQIYGWRYAINSLEQVDFPVLNLSTSFRFGKDIATLAKEVLKWKNHIKPLQEVKITGENVDTKQFKPKTTLARTNLGLLYKAIAYVSDNGHSKKLYFEGNINTYTYAEEGASLYDVLYLENKRKDKIKSKLIRSMNSLDELKDYVDKTEDVQLAMMIDLVEQYGNEIFNIINSLKELHVPDGEKEKADMVFSTVHKSKGMEYDSVQLANDFLSEKQIKKLLTETKKEELNFNKVNEEINLLYVALTRAKNTVFIPDHIVPEGLEKSPHISLVKDAPEKKESRNDYLPRHREKVYSSKSKNKTEVFVPAFDRENEDIATLYAVGFSIDEIALQQKMSYSEVKDRLNKLGLTRKRKK
ncbi:MAG: ATP-dependent helicase [Bacteroidetes bacterium]|nr:ATP-dependent helicase [Bacteroidota bacterium]